LKKANKNFVEEQPEAPFGEKWGEALAFNTKLLHLDLSFNRIDFYNTRALAALLTENVTLFGLHYTGNMGRIDSLGYLHPIEKSFFQNPRTWHFTQKIKGVKSILKEHKSPPMSPPKKKHNTQLS